MEERLMEEKDSVILELKQELARWRGRAIEAVETACQNCRNNDLGPVQALQDGEDPEGGWTWLKRDTGDYAN